MCLGGAELALLGSVVGAAGSIQQGKAQAAAYNAQAQANEQNSRIAERQAQEEAASGAREERLIRRQTQQEMGAQRAMFAANGLDSSSGSPLDIQTGTAFNGEMDALTTRRNTSFNVWGMQNQAVGYRNQARADRAAAKNAKTAGYIGAAGSLLTGASNYDKYRTKKKP